MRYLFILFFIILAVFVFLKTELNPELPARPAFMEEDAIAADHKTNMRFSVKADIQPDSVQQSALVRDYNALWAHLNDLYGTGNIEAMREYTTEPMFRQLCGHDRQTVQGTITRSDINHHAGIINWSADGLVCNLMDTVTIKTVYPAKAPEIAQWVVAMALLYQGDHWRLDGMRLLTNPYSNN